MIKKEPHLAFADVTYESLDEMAEQLLAEVYEQLRKIRVGEEENSCTTRKYVLRRLVQLQHQFGDLVPHLYRTAYNDAWSQVYYWEHKAGYKHPYLRHMMERLIQASQQLSH
ncbi:hypothetical protein [Rubeoparvulum massiliense]|uniref:hypothetical protein n=1 Tax=Rubeoparvulum massiliense TaxID=1631346 RepID=UPI00065E21DB|nr:hypothetical protein [Rubeoparvulum massiliense]